MGYKVVTVVGARPNYMKVAPIWRAFDAQAHVSKKLIHTGQHYDANMSKVFFDDLKLPRPDSFLGVGSGSHGEQTGKVMIEMERILSKEMPDMLLVVGDVNSTMASALVGVKLGIPVAHVESGLRSFDRTMPEELNRIVTDAVADVLFTTEPSAETNLQNEGIPKERIHFVGNVMIDSLMYYRPMAEASSVLEDLGLTPKQYGLVTLHRPSNVDDPDRLRAMVDALVELGGTCPLIFPAHPRTHKIMQQNKIEPPPERLRIIDPIGYLEFVKLMVHARLVLTDSGGIQEETTVLGIPCLTVRENTERPITIEVGTNRLVGVDAERIRQEGFAVLQSDSATGTVPDLWDGKASERIVRVIDEYCL